MVFSPVVQYRIEWATPSIRRTASCVQTPWPFPFRHCEQNMGRHPRPHHCKTIEHRQPHRCLPSNVGRFLIILIAHQAECRTDPPIFIKCFTVLINGGRALPSFHLPFENPLRLNPLAPGVQRCICAWAYLSHLPIESRRGHKIDGWPTWLPV